MTQISLTPYQTLDSGPTCHPFSRVGGERSKNRQKSRREWLCAAQVKHTVIVYAWAEGSKLATVEEFQEEPLAFTWPYFLPSTCLERVISHWLFDTCSTLPPGSQLPGLTLTSDRAGRWRPSFSESRPCCQLPRLRQVFKAGIYMPSPI